MGQEGVLCSNNTRHTLRIQLRELFAHQASSGRNWCTTVSRIVSSYLSDRVMEYDTEDGRSSYDVTAGVAQGSALGPHL
ncbi:GH22360 [Drosophila grimshawi]|uniref:GH22360 n=1 Tax=Drosophila grimshawi TaxID=7222 RepID=B4JYS7_DROGR|nr:GH22360 [Drosophila grimshawi]